MIRYFMMLCVRYKLAIVGSVSVMILFIRGLMVIPMWQRVYSGLQHLDTLYYQYSVSGSVSIDPAYIPYIQELPIVLQPLYYQLYAQGLLYTRQYTGALSLIQGNDQLAYINRSIIKTLWAYDLSMSGSLTGIQQAVGFIDDAYRDISRAMLLPYDKFADVVISQKNTIQILHTLIGIQQCFVHIGYIVDSLDTMVSEIDAIQVMIHEQQKYLEKEKNQIVYTVGQVCYDLLYDGLAASQQSMATLGNVLQVYQDRFAREYVDKLSDMHACMSKSYEDTIAYIHGVQEAIDEVSLAVGLNAMVFASNDAMDLQQLCDSALNGGQSSEKMKNALDQMMQNMNEKLQPEKPEQSDDGADQADTTDESSATQPSDNMQQEANPTSNQSPQHQRVYDPYEQQLLQDTLDNSEQWIKQMQQIKGQGNYSPQSNIQELFKNFYGNPEDFQDLLREKSLQNINSIDRSW